MGIEDVPAGRAIDRARRDQPDQPGELRRVNCDWVRRGVPDPEVVTGDPVRGRLRLEIRAAARVASNSRPASASATSTAAS